MGGARKHCPHENPPAYKCAECVSAYAREWRLRRIESDPTYLSTVRERSRDYQKSLPIEVRREQQRNWQRANPGMVAENNRKRKARVRGADGDGLSAAEWTELQSYFGGRCAYCLKPARLTQDHMAPVSRGGRHDAINIVPACASCNSAKRDHTPLEFAALTANKEL